YLKQGLARGERCLYVVDDATAAEVAEALRRAGVAVDAEQDRGALTIITKRESYLRSGRFDPSAMLAFLDEAVREAVAGGFAGLRVTGEMTWALGPEAGNDRVMEYERSLRHFLPGRPVVAICQYNRARFDPAVIRDTLRAHPVAIVGGEVYDNIHYEADDAATHVQSMLDTLKRARDTERRMRLLADASHLFASSLAYEETLRNFARLAVPALADVCVIDVEEPGGPARWVAGAHDEGVDAALVDRLRAFPPGANPRNPVERALATGASQIEPRVTARALEEIARGPEHRAVMEALGVTSYMIVPLVARGRILGIVSFGSTRPARRYDGADLAFAEEIARRAAIAIDNARLYRESEGRRREAQALLDVGRALSATLDPEEVGRRIVDAVRQLVGARMTALYRFDASSGQFLLVAGWGPKVEWNQVLVRGAGSPAVVLRERRPFVTPDVLADARVSFAADARARMERSDYRAVATVPVMRGDEVIATLTVGDRPGRVFTDDEVRLLQTFAHQAALALENARLYAGEQAARAEAQAGSRAKDEFLAIVSHELRNPLGAVMSAVGLLDRIGDAREPAVRARAIIRRQTEHLSRLLEDLLDVARLTTVKVALVLRPHDLAEVVRRGLDALRAAGALDRHHAAADLHEAWVEGDEARLVQVFNNLMLNALKFTPAGGAISVRVGPEGPDAVLRVTDTGVGIAPELLPRLFDLFTQGQRGLDRREGGLGVGLAVVQRLVEQHGGRVEAHSEGLGRGSTFVVRLPRVAAPSRPRPAAGFGAAAPPVGRRHILLVEDNADAREVLAAALRLDGHVVEEAGSGGEALGAALRIRPEVVILDIGLPDLDGYEVARRLRAALGDGVRLVALTGYGQAADRARSVDAGFDAHLVKPVGPEEISALTARLSAGGDPGRSAGPDQ
ncbi:MAG: MEDS domain-containing protein, partial [Candidatus Rokubacteria bacterium]|nr:MEDS domain-containing protein [Candidatus Rokubacteria bacterium]